MTDRDTDKRKGGQRVAGRQMVGRRKSETENEYRSRQASKTTLDRQQHWLTITTQAAAAINHWRRSTTTWTTRATYITAWINSASWNPIYYTGFHEWVNNNSAIDLNIAHKSTVTLTVYDYVSLSGVYLLSNIVATLIQCSVGTIHVCWTIDVTLITFASHVIPITWTCNCQKTMVCT